MVFKLFAAISYGQAYAIHTDKHMQCCKVIHDITQATDECKCIKSRTKQKLLPIIEEVKLVVSPSLQHHKFDESLILV